MIKFLVLGLALVFSTGGAAANQNPGNWTCSSRSGPIILEIEGYTIRMSPDIEITAASYQLSGLTRIWDLDDTGFSKIRIKPDGNGAYLEGFSTELLFDCILAD